MELHIYVLIICIIMSGCIRSQSKLEEAVNRLQCFSDVEQG